MADRYILKKDHLVAFLRRLRKGSRLVAPVRNRQGDTMFSQIDSLDSTEIDLENQAQGSPKPFLFPQQETLFTYRSSSPGDYSFTEIAVNEPTIFFGLRSCDLSAILYQDLIFLGRRQDPYYLQRRKDAVLISLGCNEPFANCFCNATRSGPFLEIGYDLQLTDLGDRYFVEIGRAPGRKLISDWQQFFKPAAEDDRKAQYQLSLEARGRFKQQVYVDQAIRRLQQQEVPDKIWAALSLRCQDCAGCAYICPTCTCFTITDRPLSADRGERVRSWDACTFAGFTRMAGGHNPVNHKTHAIRKRFLHKLLHDVQKHGRPSCVGCGRCVGICFGGVDIVKFIKVLCDS